MEIICCLEEAICIKLNFKKLPELLIALIETQKGLLRLHVNLLQLALLPFQGIDFHIKTLSQQQSWRLPVTADE